MDQGTTALKAVPPTWHAKLELDTAYVRKNFDSLRHAVNMLFTEQDRRVSEFEEITRHFMDKLHGILNEKR